MHSRAKFRLHLQSRIFYRPFDGRWKTSRNETISRRRDTCLIMTRKRYPWEKGWQFADLSVRLPRICLEPALSPHVGHATRHTQVTAPTVKLIFYAERERGFPSAKDTDTPSPWLSHLQAYTVPFWLSCAVIRGKRAGRLASQKYSSW